MKKTRSIIALLVVLGLVLTTVSFVVAQQQQQRQGGRNRQQRQFNPEEMMVRSMGRIMEQMKMSEDEAAVLKPMIEEIMRVRIEQGQKRREAVQALNDALDAKDSEKIAENLEKIKNMQKADKEKAEGMENDLLELLILEQEARLTVLGVVNSSSGIGGFRGGPPGGFGGNRQRRQQ